MKRALPNLDTYLDHLRSLSGVLEVEVTTAPNGKTRAIDGFLRVETKSGPKKVPFQVKRSHLLREAAESIVHQAASNPQALGDGAACRPGLGPALREVARELRRPLRQLVHQPR